MLLISIRNKFVFAATLLAVFVATKTNAAEMAYAPPTPTLFKEAVYPVNSVATGTVVVIAVVERDGQVSEARVVKSVASLDEPSVRAAKQWRFEPARLDGRPIRSKASISFVYDRGLFPPGKPKK
jgi:TonB family protein